MSLEYLLKQMGENERVLHRARQHWVFLVTRVFRAALACIGIVVLVSLLIHWTPEEPWIAWGYVLVLIPGVMLTWRVLQWLVKVYVVTNRRVARVAGVLNKNVKDSSLEKVNDVVLTQSLFGRALGYGNVEILTASESGINKMRMLVDPVAFKTAMVNAKETLEREFGHSM